MQLNFHARNTSQKSESIRFLKSHKGVERKYFVYTYIHISLILSKLFAHIYTAKGEGNLPIALPQLKTTSGLLRVSCISSLRTWALERAKTP